MSHGPQPSAHSLESLFRAEDLLIQEAVSVLSGRKLLCEELEKRSDKS